MAPLRAEFDNVLRRVPEAQNGGELMGLPVGTIEEGKLADLLVVDGDPSVDIAVLRDPAKLRAIVKGGSFLRDAL